MNNISVEPIVNWIGTQLEGQSIPKTIESQLKGNHPGFPEGRTACVRNTRQKHAKNISS
jgi:hypothetical protein